jgi:putative aldouronate transport system permease protein
MKKGRVRISKRGRWTKNDTELTLLALPTAIWYILFSFLPIFGLVIAFKNYKVTGGKSFIYNVLHSCRAVIQKYRKEFWTAASFVPGIKGGR